MPFNLANLETSEGRTEPIPTLHSEFPLIIDNTAREQFFTCPMKFRYSTIGKLQPLRKSIHLHAGGAYAAGLEVIRKSFYDLHMSEEDSLLAGVETCVKFYGDYEPYPNDTKTCERMVGALDSYVAQYPLATDPIKPYKYSPTKSAIEFTFAIPLEDCLHPVTKEPILYAGRFDMLAVRNDILFVEDDKTTSQLGPQWGNQWDLNSQFTGYIWAAQQFDLPVAGAIIRGQSILKTSYGHAQVVTYRPDWMIERWHEQLVRDVQRAIRCWEEDRFDFAIGATCTAYSGCEFKTLCTARNPLDWLPHYSQRHWNPTEKNPEEPLTETIVKGAQVEGLPL